MDWRRTEQAMFIWTPTDARPFGGYWINKALPGRRWDYLLEMNEEMKIFTLLHEADTVKGSFLTGSTVIMADVEDYEPGDLDIAVLVDQIDDNHFFSDWITPDFDTYATDQEFQTFRKDDVNLLVFTHEAEFEAVREATQHAVAVKMHSKTERYRYFAEKRAEALK